MACANCGQPHDPQDRFCEACGHSLAVAPTSALGCQCTDPKIAVDTQGFCLSCGMKRKLPLRDHFEICLSPTFSGVSDRGLKHERNEDAIAMVIEEIGGHLYHCIVIADGISTSQNPEKASWEAATTACDSILTSLRSGAPAIDSLRLGIRAATDAVGRVPYLKEISQDPPSTTIVATLVMNRQAVVAWLGDSRTYWVTDRLCEQVTVDHSWFHDTVATGEMTADEARKNRFAHHITKWLAPDEHDDPSIVEFEIPPGATIISCSDGLWNYAEAPEDLAVLIRAFPPHVHSLTLCRALIDFANTQGGKDNITVAVLT